MGIKLADWEKYLLSSRMYTVEHISCLLWSRSNQALTIVIMSSQLFDVKTCNLLSQVVVSHHSTIQYCDFCPGDELVAVALSHCSVEVSDWLCFVWIFFNFWNVKYQLWNNVLKFYVHIGQQNSGLHKKTSQLNLLSLSGLLLKPNSLSFCVLLQNVATP